MTEKIQTNEEETFEQKKEKMLSELLQTPLKMWDSSKENTKTKQNGVLNEGTVGDVISEKEVWFASDKPRPIITEEGFNKLVKATGAQFPKKEFIEKQSDFGSFERGQVVVEATVHFPGAEPHEQNHSELGVANPLNCEQKISKANMPIMALKRAKARAFFRSPYINMVVYDESEVSEDLSKLYETAVKKRKEAELELQQKELLVKKAENQTASVTKKTTEFFELVKANTKVKGRSIWEMNDLEKIKQYVEKNKAELNPLEEKLFTLRMAELQRELKNKEAEEKKAKEEEKVEGKPEVKTEETK